MNSLSLSSEHRPDMTEILLKKDVKSQVIRPSSIPTVGFSGRILNSDPKLNRYMYLLSLVIYSLEYKNEWIYGPLRQYFSLYRAASQRE